MIVITDGKHCISTYHDSEWYSKVQYISLGENLHAFKVNPSLINEREVLGANVGEPGVAPLSPWSHNNISDVAIEEVPMNVDYS